MVQQPRLSLRNMPKLPPHWAAAAAIQSRDAAGAGSEASREVAFRRRGPPTWGETWRRPRTTSRPRRELRMTAVIAHLAPSGPAAHSAGAPTAAGYRHAIRDVHATRNG